MARGISAEGKGEYVGQRTDGKKDLNIGKGLGQEHRRHCVRGKAGQQHLCAGPRASQQEEGMARGTFAIAVEC